MKHNEQRKSHAPCPPPLRPHVQLTKAQNTHKIGPRSSCSPENCLRSPNINKRNILKKKYPKNIPKYTEHICCCLLARTRSSLPAARFSFKFLVFGQRRFQVRIFYEFYALLDLLPAAREQPWPPWQPPLPIPPLSSLSTLLACRKSST